MGRGGGDLVGVREDLLRQRQHIPLPPTLPPVAPACKEGGEGRDAAGVPARPGSARLGPQEAVLCTWWVGPSSPMGRLCPTRQERASRARDEGREENREPGRCMRAGLWKEDSGGKGGFGPRGTLRLGWYRRSRCQAAYVLAQAVVMILECTCAAKTRSAFMREPGSPANPDHPSLDPALNRPAIQDRPPHQRLQVSRQSRVR